MRYAVYLAPAADSALWRFGCAILGRDAETGAEPAPPDLAGFDAERWREITAEPRRYGFHGTLKAPFSLKPGLDEAALLEAVAAVAAEHRPFELPPLAVSAIGRFVALTPQVAVPTLDDIAACVVTDLDPLRAPLTDGERARRRPHLLSPRQVELLDTCGYPYVLEEFRFHMTLTGPLGEAEQGHALNALADAFAASGARVPAEITDLAVFAEPARGAPFRLIQRMPLGVAVD
ncbi:DUF1045 domain-containing protein [Xanthobacter tagetidis]|uniref:DUF1045 domain-containing protein n=1 Tax=Xanthobacter tagetidis TaxID=60216 RepID=UPI0018116FCB|nr:DUF1045 domain-containing protein [Xanthobacter tagetidis]MBB6308521.1 putative phosphonate metabolism protein [Xanthobacter tagetidis]